MTQLTLIILSAASSTLASADEHEERYVYENMINQSLATETTQETGLHASKDIIQVNGNSIKSRIITGSLQDTITIHKSYANHISTGSDDDTVSMNKISSTTVYTGNGSDLIELVDIEKNDINNVFNFGPGDNDELIIHADSKDFDIANHSHTAIIFHKKHTSTHGFSRGKVLARVSHVEFITFINLENGEQVETTYAYEAHHNPNYIGCKTGSKPRPNKTTQPEKEHPEEQDSQLPKAPFCPTGVIPVPPKTQLVDISRNVSTSLQVTPTDK